MAMFSIIKFDGIPNRNWLVYHYPGNSFTYGSQLIVNEGQVAVFVKGGKALVYFAAGTYTLKTENIPILKSFVSLPFSGQIPHQQNSKIDTPFSVDIYFINKTVKLDIFWGTTDPISLIDPKYNIRLRVRAFGQFGIRVSDYRLFLTELIGAMGMDEVVKFEIVSNYFKGLVVNKVKTIIADIIINQRLSVLDIAPKLEEVSESCSGRIQSEFARFGIEIINFFVDSVNFPDEDFEIINKILGEKAAFDIIGDNRYSVKRTFDVMETSAGNEGNGSLASTGIGLGIGAGAGMAVGGVFANAAANTIASPGQKIACSQCGTLNDSGFKFCGNCGGSLIARKLQCSACNFAVPDGNKFCPNCGASMQQKKCPNCFLEYEPGTKFCNECGTKLEG